RVGLNYFFGGEQDQASDTPATPDDDRISLHGQSTFVAQGYTRFRSPYQGANSLPGGGEGRETFDATLYAGVRLWQGAELWVNPEIDQGFGLASTHGLAGFSSGEAYKKGTIYPYALVNRFFVRQTIDLGGADLSIEADQNQFARKTTENRVVLTVGKFSVTDIFDTNKYANNAREQFLNWALVNAGTFDYAADAWGYTYGAAAEWYQGDWTLRGGLFDLSKTPTGGSFSASGYGLDPSFSQFQVDTELEHRHKLWGQPGAVKITGFFSDGRLGSFKAANYLTLTTGLDASDALAAVRHWQTRSGVSINLQQQVTESVGIFARAGVSNGNVEPVDFTDIDRTVSAGVSVNGKQWGRPDDTVGVGGVINGIAPVHREYFNLGGLGILIGDGQLPKYGNEKIFEAYYSFSVAKNLSLTVDYQFADAPAYNLQRGPVSIGTLRLHAEF
ncbi:MAG: carbohydrate porin, partial [Solirubrobacterales bacterium]|nr:carbohydrate porin [Solirubrobacterales bacterium]